MHIVNCFTDPRIGGPGKRSIAVSKRLRKRGMKVEFLVPSGDDSLSNHAKEAGFGVHRINLPRIRTPRSVSKNVDFIRTFQKVTDEIRKLIDSLSPDIAHVNTPYNFQTARAVAQSDSSLLWHFNDILTPWPISQMAAIAAKKWADGIAVTAEVVKNYFFNKHVNCYTLYPPVNLKKYDSDNMNINRKDIQTALNIDEEKPVVGAIGNINKIKGYEYFIESIVDVVREYGEVNVVIVGSQLESQESYYQNLKKIIKRNNLEKLVKFAGWRSDIPELLSLFDLFVVPSVSETGPMVALEAMAMKCPVVTTDVGVIQEQFQDGTHAWVVPPKDPGSLSRAIVSALTSPDERKFRALQARKHTKEVFSLDTCVNKHIDAYYAVRQSN